MADSDHASPVAGEGWRPNASIETLRSRAEFLHKIREFFHRRQVMEVETPMLSVAGNTSPHIVSFSSQYQGPGENNGRTCYLHTSPEFPMKRLLAAGSGAIYQLCKVFRNGELGGRHNPEFTMLEWYRPGWQYQSLMDEVADLLAWLCDQPLVERFTYAELFQQYLSLDVHLADALRLQAEAVRHGLDVADWPLDDVDIWRDLLMSHLIEPALGQDRPVFVYDYPASQAALAQVRREATPVAERFELYWRGVELANGYQELLDANVLAERMDEENAMRQRLGLPSVARDERLLAAQRSGLPLCSGVALGVDRLFMLQQALSEVSQGLSFSFSRA